MSKSSARWLKEHFNDVYVKKAQKEGWRSRAAYKLLEIQEKDKILKPGMTVVDLGAAPGGWSQVAAKLIGAKGRILALDILPFDPLEHVEILLGDFREESILELLLEKIGKDKVDLVISDMAPNMSGVKAVDQPRGMALAELALDLADRVLTPGGDLLMKVFMGQGADGLRSDLKSRFDKVLVRKPQASRARSAEQYWLARGYRGIS